MSRQSAGGRLPQLRRFLAPRRVGHPGVSCRQIVLVLATILIGAELSPAAVTTQGDVTLSGLPSGASLIGQTGYGSVAVDDGSELTAQILSLGSAATAVGVLNVSDAGSRVEAETLNTGLGGLGLVSVVDKGRLATSSAFLGRVEGGYGQVVVDGPGSLWTNASLTFLGLGGGTGKAVAVNGGRIESGSLAVGDASRPASGYVAVSGVGSTWINRGGVSLNGYGTAEMKVLDGGTFLNLTPPGAITVNSRNDGGMAALEVAGAGSLWNAFGEMQVGVFGRGTSRVRVSDGGTLAVSGLTLGTTAASAAIPPSAHVFVSGEGSSLNLAGALTIRGPSAFLSVTQGGRVVSSTLNVLGPSASADANSVFISGAGSTLRATSASLGPSSLTNGPANVWIADGGTLEAASSNSLVVNPGGVLRLLGGNVRGAPPASRGGQGMLRNSGVVEGWGTIDLGVENASNATLAIRLKQVLAVTGNISNAATVAVERGELTIEGDFNQTSNGTLKIASEPSNLSPPPTPLAVGGVARLAGKLDFSLISAFVFYQPSIGTSFTLLEAAGGVQGTFHTTALPPLDPHLAWLIDYQPQSVALRVVGATSGPASGDFNGDGRVNGADLAVWQAEYGNQQGATAGGDFLTWQRNHAATAVNAAIPEPAAFWLALGIASSALFIVSNGRSRTRPIC
ncbi:MAG: hypothetical protein KF847_01035 [Pirellulales bacterium]|nr:hypothetical protein [Pirellulales bacterium]